MMMCLCEFKRSQWDLEKLEKRRPDKRRILRLCEREYALGNKRSPFEDLNERSTPYDAIQLVLDFVSGLSDRQAIRIWRSIRGVEL